MFWYELNDYKLEYKEYDVAYTVMKQWKEIILFYSQYDIIHILNYDINVTDEIYNLSMSYIQLFEKSIFYENFSIPNRVQVIFFSILKKDFNHFSSILDKEQFLSFPIQRFLPSIEEYLTSRLTDNYYVVPYRNCEFYMDEFLKNEFSHVIFSGVKRKPTYVKSKNGYYEPDIDKFLFVNKDIYSVFFGHLDEVLYCLIFEIKKDVKLKKNGTEYNISGYHFLISIDINDEIEIDGELIDKDFIQSFLKLECKIYKKQLHE
jgi:hypothetical protein